MTVGRCNYGFGLGRVASCPLAGIAALFSLCLWSCVPADQSGGVIGDTGTVATHELFQLEEGPQTQLGDFSWLYFWRDGIVIADMTNSVLTLFDSTGHRRGALGRLGSGPGEFRRIGGLMLLDDTTALAADIVLKRATRWNLASGKVIGTQMPMNLPDAPVSLATGPGVLLASVVNPKDLSTVVIHDRESYAIKATGAKAPGLYHDSRWVAASYALAFALPVGDSLLVGWTLVDTLQLFSRTLEPGRKIPVPRLRRRGTPADLLARGKTIGDVNGMVPHTSLLFKAGLLSEGRVALVHGDLVREVDSQGRGRGGSREVWLTILDRLGRPLCVDQRLTERTEDVVRVHFRADQLLISRTSAEDGVTRLYGLELPLTCASGG